MNSINDCTKFLLQGFKFQSNYYKSFEYLFALGFKNCYLCKNLKSRHLYLVFDYSYSKEFIIFNYQIKNKKGFIDTIHKNKQIIYILEYPIQFQYEYSCFLKGKYSKFRPLYKSMFPKFIKIGNQIFQSKIYNVLYKDIIAKKLLEEQFKIQITTKDEYYPMWSNTENIWEDYNKSLRKE